MSTNGEPVGPVGMVDPRACIGMPPEHRDHRWKTLHAWQRGGLVAAGFHAPVIHPTAIVEAFASVDAGLDHATVISARVYVMKHAHVGHDAMVADDVNLAPHVVLGGHVRVMQGTRIGIGAVVRPRITIGERCVIGAGAVVVDDVPNGEVWVGNPARPIKRRNHDYGMKTPDTWTGSEEEYQLWLEAFSPRYRP